MNYNYAAELISKTRTNQKKVAHNTYLHENDRGIAVKFHQTDIITMLPNGLRVLNSGGFRTVTTKQRLNRFSPARIFQEKKVWYVEFHGKKTLFFDGIIIDADGCPAGNLPTT